jgi:hypothetical protein
VPPLFKKAIFAFTVSLWNITAQTKRRIFRRKRQKDRFSVLREYGKESSPYFTVKIRLPFPRDSD